MTAENDEDDGRSDPSRPTKLVTELRYRYAADFADHRFQRVFENMDDERTRAADEIMRLRWIIRNMRRNNARR